MAASTDNVLFYQRLIGAVGLALVAYLVFRILQPFLAPIAWALFIGFLLQPQQARLTQWLRGRASIAAFGLTILVLVLFLGPLTALAFAFARQAADLAHRLQDNMQIRDDSALRHIDQLPVVGNLLDWLDRNFQVSTAHVQEWLVEGAQRLFQQLAGYGGVAFFGAVGTVLSFTVMLFILFFIIRDGRAIARLGAALVPLPPERREDLADRLASVTRAVVRGTVVTAIVQGCLTGIGFGVVGLPAPVVFGVLAAVLSVVPFGGTALVWAPAVIVLAVQGNYPQAVILLVFGAVISSVDNFLKPLLISGRTVLPTLAVFIGVLGGLAAFGVIGLFLGPVVLALVLALIEFQKGKGDSHL
ncbi:MAG TPA: AI-2E family transporter [Steroidobacteraceae bacterium]|nr:AI-2E family transporter [Steroidobacteraceae bacterium]